MHRFFDEFLLAFQGLTLVLRKKSFWLSFIICFIIFGTLLNLLSNGLSSFRLLFSSSPTLAFSILKTAFLGIFGVNKTFLDWSLNFILTLLQSILISLLIFLFRSNRAQLKAAPGAMESSALVTGLLVLGSGCPTCGTTLLAPLLATLFSGASGSLAVAGALSLILNLLAILIGLLAFRRLGLITYATIKSEKYSQKKDKK